MKNTYLNNKELETVKHQKVWYTILHTLCKCTYFIQIYYEWCKLKHLSHCMFVSKWAFNFKILYSTKNIRKITSKFTLCTRKLLIFIVTYMDLPSRRTRTTINKEEPTRRRIKKTKRRQLGAITLESDCSNLISKIRNGIAVRELGSWCLESRSWWVDSHLLCHVHETPMRQQTRSSIILVIWGRKLYSWL